MWAFHEELQDVSSRLSYLPNVLHFFRDTDKDSCELTCSNGNRCHSLRSIRNCKKCRYERCIKAGLSKSKFCRVCGEYMFSSRFYHGISCCTRCGQIYSLNHRNMHEFKCLNNGVCRLIGETRDCQRCMMEKFEEVIEQEIRINRLAELVDHQK